TPHGATPARPGASEPAPRSLRARLAHGPTRAALVAALLVLVTGVVWLTRPGGDVQGLETQSVVVTGISGAVQEGTEIIQEVRATEDGLTGFEATFGTYGGVTDCAVDVRVTAPDGSVLSDAAVPCADLVDTSRASQVAHFDPVPDSAGQVFTVTYTGAPGDWSQAVTMWVGTPRGAAMPATAQGDAQEVLDVFEDEPVATATIAEYRAPSVWDQVWRALGLAALGAPWWVQPWAVAAAAVVLVLSVVGALALSDRRRAAVVLLVAVAVGRGLVWSALLPPLEGMDEGAHVAYAQFMAEERLIPVRDRAYEDIPVPYSDELTVLDQYQNRGALPPGDRPSYLAEDVERVDEEMADASPRASGSAPAAGYPPTYYLPAAVLYELTPGTLEDRIHAMRLWSVALGALAAWATLAVARRLLPRSSTAAMLLALAVTLQPMMAHQFAIVNNDGLVIAGGIAAFAAALRLAQGSVRWRDGLLAGLAVGAALLAKQYGAGALPVVGVALLVGALRAAPRLRRVLVAGAGVAVGLAVAYVPWLVLQAVGGLPSTSVPVSSDGDPSRGLRHYLGLQVDNGFAAMRAQWGEQLFGTFAWLDVRLPGGAYAAVWWGVRIVVALVVVWLVWQAVALVRWLVRERHEPGGREGVLVPRGELEHVTRTGLSLVHVGGLMAVLYAAGYLYFRSSGRDELLQGRYALMALPAFLALLPLTLEAFTARFGERVRDVVVLGATATTAVAMWALHVVAVATIADRFYL
ncbi:DUF2142 domain-containing protein, partial [Actinotalea ferrariae]|uniref:DUF2142 domain-containing protein n=1 Tax=Actinotalea ferrariae TaxID=1386098 RepID=UPI001C8B2645